VCSCREPHWGSNRRAMGRRTEPHPGRRPATMCRTAARPRNTQARLALVTQARAPQAHLQKRAPKAARPRRGNPRAAFARELRPVGRKGSWGLCPWPTRGRGSADVGAAAQPVAPSSSLLRQCHRLISKKPIWRVLGGGPGQPLASLHPRALNAVL
jgi:hypothetical protein